MNFRYLTNLRIGGDEWTNHRIEAWHRDQKLGHITIAFIPRDVFEREFSTLDAYIKNRTGLQDISDYYRETYRARYKHFEEFHVRTAHVAYILVKERWRRQGVGTQLYIEGARWIGERHGLILAASDLQQPGVPELWEKLVANPTVPTVRLDDGRWALDGIKARELCSSRA